MPLDTGAPCLGRSREWLRQGSLVNRPPLPFLFFSRRPWCFLRCLCLSPPRIAIFEAFLGSSSRLPPSPMRVQSSAFWTSCPTFRCSRFHAAIIAITHPLALAARSQCSAAAIPDALIPMMFLACPGTNVRLRLPSLFSSGLSLCAAPDSATVFTRVVFLL